MRYRLHEETVVGIDPGLWKILSAEIFSLSSQPVACFTGIRILRNT